MVVLAAIWLAMLLGGAGATDRAVYQSLYAGGSPVLVGVARVFTFLGEPTLLVGASLLLAVWLWHVHRPRTGLGLLAVTLGGRLLGEIQKYLVGRPRPGLEPHLVVVKTHSFPSGHATSSMIFYLAVALLLAGTGHGRAPAIAAAILVSLLIGISRVMLGVHWPSDVIGGWAFGLLWVLLTLGPAVRLLRADYAPDQSARR